jgi:hypothetical protein
MARRAVDLDLSSSPEPNRKRSRTTQDNIAHVSDTRDVPDFRVAIDFGTTFTTIAFVKCNGLQDNVFTIEEFPGDRCVGNNGTQVPTEIWYPSNKTDNTVKSTSRMEPEPWNILYGYEVTRRLEMPASDPSRANYKESGLVTKPKLLLDTKAHLGGLRQDLMDVLSQLKKNKIIKKDEEVIESLLVCFLKHTKLVLERDHGLNKTSQGRLYSAHF